MYFLDITGLGGAWIWIIGLFAPVECQGLLRGGMGLQRDSRVCI